VPLNIWLIFAPKFWKKLVKFTQEKKNFPKKIIGQKKATKIFKEKINA